MTCVYSYNGKVVQKGLFYINKWITLAKSFSDRMSYLILVNGSDRYLEEENQRIKCGFNRGSKD